MSGYRDQSNFDPYASPQYGRPLRPYNWVQWSGVGFILLGLAVDLVYFAGRAGWTSQLLDSPTVSFPPIFLGAMLVNSRRETLSTEARTPSRRLLAIIAIALVAFAIGLTAALYFKGA